MANLKKIDAALKGLEVAAKKAFEALNEAADGAYGGSPAEADPVRHANEIAQNLRLAKNEIEAGAEFEGLTEEEIAEKKATDREAANEKLQAEAAVAMAKLKAQAEEKPEADLEAELETGKTPEADLEAESKTGETPEADPEE